MTDCIYLPVSLGEAIDKLTILDIKLQKIQDKRRDDVKREYDLLFSRLESYVTKYADLYKTMLRVNLLIWDMMDLLRDGALDETDYLRVCKECIEYNDTRFRVKNKFNYLSNSELKEQKSYRVNRMVIEISGIPGTIETLALIGDRVGNSGIPGTIDAGDRVGNSGIPGTIDAGDRVGNCGEIACGDFIRPIRYCSFIYDELVIVSNSPVLKQEFGYDPTILFVESYEGEFKKRIAFQKTEECDHTKIYEIFGLDEREVISLT